MGRYGRLGWLRSLDKYDHQVVDSAMHHLGIENLRHKRLDELSGGQQQRVSWSRAIAQEPHILLLDEPFNGVDISTQEAILDLFKDLESKKVTVLFSTHDLNLASKFFKTCLLLNRQLIAFGSPQTVFDAKNLARAFGEHSLHVEDTFVVDQCCGPDRKGRNK